MTVPIELAKKAARYKKLMNEANTLFEELEEWANENGYEDFYVDGFGTAQLAEGEEQLDGEYCDQTMRGEDCGDGTYYYPIDGSTMYMWVKYSF